MLPKTKTKLASMYRSEPQRGNDGKLFKIDAHTRISPEQGQCIADLYARHRPETSIEVGFAYGFSTLHILDSMHEHNYGFHVAIDPREATRWNGVGLAAVRELGFELRFQHMPLLSVAALTVLADTGVTADCIYIDGDHKFDGVMLDFYCSARILKVGGIMIFDDMWMPSIRKLSSFIKKNVLSYAEIPTPIPNLLCIKKMEKDNRGWTHFVDF